jgi:hypothetical protein
MNIHTLNQLTTPINPTSRWPFWKARFALAAMVMGFAVSAQAGPLNPEAGTLNIVYDGFCDGISVTFVANGVTFGTETGCLSGPVVGTKGAVINQGNAFSLAENHVANAIYVIRPDHTWTIYLSDGSELQSGTWSFAPAAGVNWQPGLRATGR